MKVVENLDGFRGSEKQFRNWLYKTATNAVNNHLRQAARRSRALRAVGEGGNTAMADCGCAADDDAEKVTILKKAMLTLRPRYQTIITLRFFENLKLTEIADVLGSSPGTVRSQLARALGKLRKTLASLQQEA
jgi:RNA polymerase sigma-70 factor (ECF subfamily)